jgi:N-acetylglutamate synthase-like GNAT family acetyltransferase
MSTQLRRGVTADTDECGRICFDAFKVIADRHSFPWDFPSPEVAAGLLSMLLGHPRFHGVVATREGKIVGSNFLDERSSIVGIGPISVDPTSQQRGVGRLLMEHVLARAAEKHAPGVRLVQAGYNNQSLCLYTKLGFRTREPLSLMSGSPPCVQLPGYEVRQARKGDIDLCNQLCRKLHGHDRAGELIDAIDAKTATLVERQGRITGYATSIAFFAHAVGETNQDLIALIGAASSIAGPGILVPTRNHELFSWCLDNGLGLVFQMTLMSIGLYNEPTGPYLPSVLY